MPRSARFLLANAYYHVVTRGNHKQKVFLNNRDYEYYLFLMKKYKLKFHISLCGYCLMPNHIHLMVRPQNSVEDLSLFMKSLSQTYAQYFNAKYAKCGHLWQSRFKSMVISDENYLLECIKYVEFNPVRAQLTQSPGEYLYSSYQNRVLGIESDILDSLADIFNHKNNKLSPNQRSTKEVIHRKSKEGTVPGTVPKEDLKRRGGG